MLSKRDDVSQMSTYAKLVKFHSLNICSLFIALYFNEAMFLKHEKREGLKDPSFRRAQVKVSVSQS